jgi:hypothetical protein
MRVGVLCAAHPNTHSASIAAAGLVLKVKTMVYQSFHTPFIKHAHLQNQLSAPLFCKTEHFIRWREAEDPIPKNGYDA